MPFSFINVVKAIEVYSPPASDIQAQTDALYWVSTIARK